LNDDSKSSKLQNEIIAELLKDIDFDVEFPIDGKIPTLSTSAYDSSFTPSSQDSPSALNIKNPNRSTHKKFLYPIAHNLNSSSRYLLFYSFLFCLNCLVSLIINQIQKSN
jgi:hypothetical protein